MRKTTVTVRTEGAPCTDPLNTALEMRHQERSPLVKRTMQTKSKPTVIVRRTKKQQALNDQMISQCKERV